MSFGVRVYYSDALHGASAFFDIWLTNSRTNSIVMIIYCLLIILPRKSTVNAIQVNTVAFTINIGQLLIWIVEWDFAWQPWFESKIISE